MRRSKEELLNLVKNPKISYEDATGMIFSNYLNIGGDITGLSIPNAIEAGKIFLEYSNSVDDDEYIGRLMIEELNKSKLAKTDPQLHSLLSTIRCLANRNDSEVVELLVMFIESLIKQNLSLVASLAEIYNSSPLPVFNVKIAE